MRYVVTDVFENLFSEFPVLLLSLVKLLEYVMSTFALINLFLCAITIAYYNLGSY